MRCELSVIDFKRHKNRVRELATQRAERRVAHAILRLMRKGGEETVNGTVIGFPLRRKDIADLAGTTLYSVSRILTAWEKAGWLRSADRHIVVKKPADLIDLAEDATGKALTTKLR